MKETVLPLQGIIVKPIIPEIENSTLILDTMDVNRALSPNIGIVESTTSDKVVIGDKVQFIKGAGIQVEGSTSLLLWENQVLLKFVTQE